MNDDLTYALKWVPWKDSGFLKQECPWKNPREMIKHVPRLEREARMIIWGKLETMVHDMIESRDIPCLIHSIEMVEPQTLVGKIDGYEGHVWFNPDTGQWMRVLSMIPNN